MERGARGRQVSPDDLPCTIVDPVSEPPAEAAPKPEGRIQRTTRRARAEQEKLTKRAGDTLGRLEAARPDNPVVDAVFRTYERDTATGGVVLAGALAFRVFLFLIPYAFTVVVGFGAAASASESDPTDLARKAGIAGILAHAVGTTRDLSWTERIVAVVAGLFAVLLASRGLLKVLRVVHALAWRVRAGKFPSLTKASLVLVGLVTVGIATSILVGKLRSYSFIAGLFAVFLTALIPFGIWIFVSWKLPSRAPRWQEVVPGAALFGVGVLALHAITIYWIAREVEHKSDTYGAIGAALAILLWAYILGRIMAAGAVLNMALWEQRHQDESPPAGTTG
jgi:uncharacterized BrkB/YihY/UPF0761 family membrane protein